MQIYGYSYTDFNDRSCSYMSHELKKTKEEAKVAMRALADELAEQQRANGTPPLHQDRNDEVAIHVIDDGDRLEIMVNEQEVERIELEVFELE